MKQKQSVLFFGKKNDAHTEKVLDLITHNFSDVEHYLGRFGENKLPEDIGKWKGDYIVSYLSPWIIPDNLLMRASKLAINFHPGSPDYPGIGCNNFALYDGVNEYGVTCHHMAPKVDTGKIIAVKKFSVFNTDNVGTILSRTHDYLLCLFYDIFGLIISGDDIPTSKMEWSKNPFTRIELNDLSKITADMTLEETKKRIRATTFDSWKPTTEIHGIVFEFKI